MSAFRGAFLLDANALFYRWMGINALEDINVGRFDIVFYFNKHDPKI